jgi:predicted transposase YdaD
LAPLLLLASKEKSEAVLQQERQLILNLPVTQETRRELLAVATMVGTRYFDTGTLRRIFHEAMAMLKEAEFVQEWVLEGEARGEARGISRGEARGTQAAVVRLMRSRFGSVSPDVEARVAELTAEQALELLERVANANSPAELGF